MRKQPLDNWQRARRHRAAGFTFIEILAAMLFMAIVIPVAMKGLMLANMVQERAARKRTAAELAAKILNQAIVENTWVDGDQSGNFGEDFPGFAWSIHSESWTQDTMTVVSVEISYKVQDRQFTEKLSTLAESSSTSSSSSSLSSASSE